MSIAWEKLLQIYNIKIPMKTDKGHEQTKLHANKYKIDPFY